MRFENKVHGRSRINFHWPIGGREYEGSTAKAQEFWITHGENIAVNSFFK